MVDERCFRDSAGNEWEVFDERTDSPKRALECDYPVQRADPGLVFVSRAGRKRLWPCPDDWQRLPDDVLADLCARAAELG
jgi:hypothetical protein